MRLKYFIGYGFLLFFLFNRCANPVTPEGGPKDILPPKVIECNPPALTTFFHKSDIRITFNKFIQLKDPGTQVTISPPNLPHTDIRLHGKSILIKLNDSLKTNTTYSINFGDAISDLNENNILHDFSYTFSTGPFIDSLSFTGMIINASDLAPQKDVFSMLYVNENDTLPLDSLPLHVKPYYIAKSKEDGWFTFRNLRNVPFLLFALKDMNGDYIFNLPNEKIAFSDSLIKGIYLPPLSPDSMKKDSIKRKDSLVPGDTMKRIHLSPPGITLRLFEESDSIQRILKADLVNEGELGIFFRFPAVKPEFVPLNISPGSGWMMPEFNSSNDSVYLWLNAITNDSLILQVRDRGKILDTARIDLTKKSPRKKGNKPHAEIPKLVLSNNMSDGRLNSFKNNPLITFNYPLSTFDLKRILLVDGKDTVKAAASFSDSLKRRLVVKHKWKEDQKYRLILPDSIFHSLNNRSNDSLIISFRTYSIQDFGSIQLSVDIKKPSGNYIIQLLDDKESILDRQVLTTSGKVKFDYLFPGKYKVKAVFDKNRNGHWDTGKYSLKLQPEEVRYYQQVIEVRANWDIDENWVL